MVCVVMACSGITPAYAGSTGSRAGVTVTVTDHPRVCGEHSAVGRNVMGVAGSPPRMRGARDDDPRR